MIEKTKNSGKKRGRIENLTPFKKGHKPAPNAHRPKGRRSAKGLLREARRLAFAKELDDKALEGRPNEEVWALMTMRRAILRGGHDAEVMLDRTEGKVKDRSETTIKREDDFTPEERETITQIYLARLRRANGKV